MRLLILASFVFVVQFCGAQISLRIPFQGQVISDSIKVEGVVIFNINSKIGKTINRDGFFELLVKKSDTLIFSGQQFKSKRVVVTEKLLDEKLLIVKLEPSVIQLDAVVVRNNKLNPVAGGSQKYVDTPFFDDARKSPKNEYIYNGTIVNGVNFVRLFDDVAKIFKKKKPKNGIVTKEIDFPEFTMQQIKPTFFTNTLLLKKEQIKLFLVFCENDVKIKSLIESKSEFDLMDFLLVKAKEFKEITFEKE